MLIDQLSLFLREAAHYPAVFWQGNYIFMRQGLADQMRDLHITISKKDKYTKSLEKVIAVFEKREFDEGEILEAFQTLSKIFSASGIEDGGLATFVARLKRFGERYKNEQRFLTIREQLKKTQKTKEQKQYDFDLFAKEGDGYVLEFYLVLYKTLVESTDPDIRIKLVEEDQVDFGSGDTTGIKADARKDESLNKFILLILDDDIRFELMNMYYNYKHAVLAADTPDRVQYILQQFIYDFLLVFRDMGITQLSSLFFDPYGKQPKVDDLIAKFSS